jgi:GNAT superfamily N-acetyltransferase
VPAVQHRLRDATPADLPAIAGLRHAVGWDALEWALRAAIESPTGRFVVVEGEDGLPIATGSAMAYGPLGFVGNMVVAEAHRRRGLGSTVLAAVVDHLRAARCRRIELYATPDGRRLYARHGFALIEPSLFAQVPRTAVTSVRASGIGEAGPDALTELAAYDAARFGGDRRELLGRMLADDARPVRVARRAGAIAGYAWVRPDGDRVGPLVADAPHVAAELLADAFALMPAAERVRLNLPGGNRPGAAWLAGAGADVEAWDGRMGLGPPIPRREETIYASVVGALG